MAHLNVQVWSQTSDVTRIRDLAQHTQQEQGSEQVMQDLGITLPSTENQDGELHSTETQLLESTGLQREMVLSVSTRQQRWGSKERLERYTEFLQFSTCRTLAYIGNDHG